MNESLTLRTNCLLSFIVVNCNGHKFLFQCLQSIENTVKDLCYEIWMIDNGSSDSSVAKTRELFPHVKIIENKKNVGFAKAVNLALRRMNGKYAVLLNNDTLLKRDAIRLIIELMEQEPDIGMCGGQLLNADGSKQNSIANIPNLITELTNKSFLRRVWPSKFPGKELKLQRPIEVESLIGACLVVRKKAIEDVGLLDEAYFFFFEETDWCLRFRQHGWKIFFHPAAEIVHFQGGTAKKEYVRSKIEYWKSRYIFFRKHRSITEQKILCISLFLRLVLAFTFSIVCNAFTFFAVEQWRKKSTVYFHLLHWHIKGCPSSWGLAAN